MLRLSSTSDTSIYKGALRPQSKSPRASFGDYILDIVRTASHLMAHEPDEKSRSEYIARLDVAPCLPDYAVDGRGEGIPEGIVGATIVRFGAAPVAAEIAGGGLVIDYTPRGSRDVRRLVLGFDETGMFVDGAAILAGVTEPTRAGDRE